MKRSGFKPRVKPMAGVLRTADLPAPKKPRLAAKPKTRKCDICPTRFVKRGMGHVACSPECALEVVKRNEAAARKKALAEERKADKVRKEQLKTKADYLPEAKRLLQQVRRLEELKKGSPCMSCNRSQQEIMGSDPWRPGGYFDGGHFISKGARPELALEPKNIWLQCKSCNGGSGKYARKGHTVHQSFRANLIKREGLALVEWLEGPHEAKQHTIEDLKALIADCRVRVKALKEAA